MIVLCLAFIGFFVWLFTMYFIIEAGPALKRIAAALEGKKDYD